MGWRFSTYSFSTVIVVDEEQSIGPIRRLPGRSRPGGAKTKPSILRKAEPLMVRGVENEGRTAGMEMGE